jgi:hypothetical protein
VVRWFPISRGYALGVLVYLAGALAFMVIVDANAENGRMALAVLALASLACGWLAGWWPVSLLPLVLAPLGTLFGYPESRFPEPFPLYGSAALVTVPSAGLVLLGVWLRRLRWFRPRDGARLGSPRGPGAGPGGGRPLRSGGP